MQMVRLISAGHSIRSDLDGASSVAVTVLLMKIIRIGGILNMKKRKVLIVDDELTIREGFKKLFPWEEHDCIIVGEASDGLEAINQIDICRPDVVILDINIPIMNGLEVIKISKAKYPEMAFIVVSGYDDFSYCKEAFKLKITDYILKPVNYEEFGEVIDNLKITLYQESLRHKENIIGKKDKLIFEITKYIQQHLKDEITLKVLAEKFFLSPVYVSQLFKNEIGVNFLAYLTNIRIERAKILLMSSAKSVADIAEEVGFKDYRVFSKVFKKMESVPPSQYHKHITDIVNAE